jgi:hypothetical protein
MSQDLQLFASTPRNDGMKYIVKFYSKIGGDEHWFSIVMPVQTSDVAAMRWCSVIAVVDVRRPRSHPVTIVKFPEVYIYIGKMDDVASEDFLNLPSEWSPSRPRVRPWSRAQVLAGVYGEHNCRRQLVKNI